MVLLTMLFSILPAFGNTKDLDVVLLLDSSGSMLMTDPLNLRIEGIELFVELLGETDRVSLISFDEKPKVVVPLGKIDRAEFKRNLESVQTRGEYTDIGLAFELASQILRENGRADSEKVIVLLSDGKFEPHPDRGKAEELTNALVDKTVPNELANGIRTFALAFSMEADRRLLENISNKGGGLFWYTPTSEEIHESFADLLLSSKRPQVATMGEHGFFVDELVEEATFYVTKQSGAQLMLVAPDERMYHSGDSQNIRWYRGKNFEVITIKDPIAGSWHVVGANLNDGYATLLTKLSLDTKWPTFVIAEEPTKITANLMEGEKPLALSSMSALLTMKVQVSSDDKVSEPLIEADLRDDGQHGDSVAQDGVYSAYLALPDRGRYHLRVMAESPTFEREQLLPFEVESEIISLSKVSKEELNEVLGTSHAKGDAHGEEESDNFLIKIDSPKLLKGITVTLTAKAKKKSIKMHLQKNKSGDIFFASSKELKPGKYQLQAEIKAEMKGRGAIHQKSSVLTYSNEEIVEIEEIPEEKHEKKVTTVQKTEPTEPEVVGVTMPMIILTLLNLSVFGYFFFIIKKKSGSVLDNALPSAVPQATLSMLVEIERLASESEVDFLDPRFGSSGVLSYEGVGSPEDAQENLGGDDVEEQNLPESE
jgi:uncharacterized protein (TIGR03503 family)